MKKLFSSLAIVVILFASTTHSQWIQQTLPGESNITIGIDFIDQNYGLTGGWHGDLSQQIYGNAFYTNDGGSNWIEAITPDSFRVMVSLQMINNSIAYGAGAYNKSGVQTQASSTYSQNLTPRARKYYEQIGMDFSGQENYRGYFVETTDSGLNWHPKGSFDDSVYYLVGMTFTDQLTGFVIGSSQGVTRHCILKTTDGGNNWYYVYPFEESMWIEDIKFYDNLNGLAVGEETGSGSGVILKTTNGGENWIKNNVNNMSSIFNVVYLDLNNILIAGINQYLVSGIFKSTDGGGSWQQFHTYTDLHFIDGVDAIQNSGVILAYGGYYPSGTYIPVVDISLNNGATWDYSVFNQFTEYILLGSKMINETNWYLCGGWVTLNGLVLFTDNSGGVPVELVSFNAEIVAGNVQLNWTTASELNNMGFEVERKSDDEDWRTIGFIDGKGTTTEIQNYSFIDDLFGVTAPKLFYRLKQIDFDGTYEYSEEKEVARAPEAFSLEQNYPNPFNPTTTIKYQLPELSFVTIKMFDVLGNELETLVNEEKPVGSYEIEFNASALPSGVYFYRLQAGDFVETKKMVLLK